MSSSKLLFPKEVNEAGRARTLVCSAAMVKHGLEVTAPARLVVQKAGPRP